MMSSEYTRSSESAYLFNKSYSDLFSFYKEELRGETTNQVSLMAQREGISKLCCLKMLSEGSIERIQRSKDVLASFPDAQQSFHFCEFLNGYLNFHFREPRYKLHELNLPSQPAPVSINCEYDLKHSAPY